MANDKLEKPQTQALATALPEGLITDQRPTEKGEGGKFTLADIAMPRLSLVQKTSKEIEPGEARFIEGAKFTDIFHSGDRRLFGNGPIYFSVLRYYPPRWVEFKPMDQGGGIVDLNVPPGDERTEWHGEQKPVATKYVDYIVLLLNGFDPADPMNNVVAISFKSTGLKAMKELNKLIQWRGPVDLFRGVYKATTFVDKNPKGSFAAWKFANAQWLAEGSPAYPAARDAWEALKTVDVKVERDFEPDDSFDPEDLERQPAHAGAPEM